MFFVSLLCCSKSISFAWFRLGNGPYKVKMTVEFPEDRKLPTKAKKPIRSFVLELADLYTMPHSVHIFLEQVSAHLWDNTAFIINPGHVIQAAAVSGDGAVADKAKLEGFESHRLKNVAFQEYNETFPHERWTFGFAGRPGGPDFYINTQNNTIPHGPGGQKHHELTNDADPCFGKVVEGISVIKDIMKRPTKRSLYVKRITIKSAQIVYPILQHDPHEEEEEEEEKVSPAKPADGRKNNGYGAASNDEPDAIPDYVNRDKGSEKEE
jgi:cyclophilin family peptidyl-prolyl cis-trans isomerase